MFHCLNCSIFSNLDVQLLILFNSSINHSLSIGHLSFHSISFHFAKFSFAFLKSFSNFTNQISLANAAILSLVNLISFVLTLISFKDIELTISLIESSSLISLPKTSDIIFSFLLLASSLDKIHKSIDFCNEIYGIKVLISNIFSLSLNKFVLNNVLISESTNLQLEISDNIAITSFFILDGERLSNLSFFSSSDNFHISTGNKSVCFTILFHETQSKNFSNSISEFNSFSKNEISLFIISASKII
jgi:hypothetical protein